MQAKFFRIFLLSVLMVGAIVAQAGERHTEPAGGFSYEVPDDWTLSEFAGLKYKIIYTTPVNQFAPNITFVDDNYKGSLKQYLKASIPSMKSGVPGFSVVKQAGGKTLQGREYLYMDYTHRPKNSDKLIQRAYMLKLSGDRKLVVTCTSPSGHEAKYNAVCHKTVKSLQVQ